MTKYLNSGLIFPLVTILASFFMFGYFLYDGRKKQQAQTINQIDPCTSRRGFDVATGYHVVMCDRGQPVININPQLHLMYVKCECQPQPSVKYDEPFKP